MNDSAPHPGRATEGRTPDPPPAPAAPHGAGHGRRDYLVRTGGGTYAGMHVLVDVWGAGGLGGTGAVKALLRGAAERAGARVLHVHAHRFGGDGGVSGVAVLAESHISVHTWPEIGYAAFDVFMCGSCRPQDAVAHLRRELRADRFEVREVPRGLVT